MVELDIDRGMFGHTAAQPSAAVSAVFIVACALSGDLPPTSMEHWKLYTVTVAGSKVDIHDSFK